MQNVAIVSLPHAAMTCDSIQLASPFNRFWCLFSMGSCVPPISQSFLCSQSQLFIWASLSLPATGNTTIDWRLPSNRAVLQLKSASLLSPQPLIMLPLNYLLNLLRSSNMEVLIFSLLSLSSKSIWRLILSCDVVTVSPDPPPPPSPQSLSYPQNWGGGVPVE